VLEKVQALKCLIHGQLLRSDGKLNIILSSPRSNAAGTNPKQLFVAGW